MNMIKKGKPSHPEGAVKKRKYGNIDAEMIVTVALRIIRREGALKLSMRKLSAELGMSPMAVYYYVPNKKELINRVIERIHSQMSIANTPGSPEDKFRSLFWQSVEAEIKYPGLPLSSFVDSPGPESARLVSELDEVLKQLGCSKRFQLAGNLLFYFFISGAAMIESEPGLTINQVPVLKNTLDDGLSVILAGLQALGKRKAPTS